MLLDRSRFIGHAKAMLMTYALRVQVLGIEGSDCAWSFVDRMFLANELLDAADAAGESVLSDFFAHELCRRS